MKENGLSGRHLTIWNKLRNLKDGERIIGRDLMTAARINDERAFYGVIEDLRRAGYQIGASKELYNPGYYEIRIDKDAWDYHFHNIKALEREIDRITSTTKSFFINKYGKSFDFIKHKYEEEMKRHGGDG